MPASFAPIGGLGLRVSPTAVPGLIAALIVNAVKRAPQRLWTHVIKKRTRAFKPLITHSDASTAVIRVLGIVGVGAARFGLAVAHKFRRSTTLPVRPVGKIHCCNMLVAQAPAGTRMPIPEIAAANDDAITAGALAIPERLTLRGHPCGTSHDKMAKRLADEVKAGREFSHTCGHSQSRIARQARTFEKTKGVA